MAEKFSKKASDYLESEHQTLRMIIVKAKYLEALNRQFCKIIPATISNFCYVTNVIQERLIVMAANGSVATQLRFEGPDLLRKLRSVAGFEGIKKIECKVSPHAVMPGNRDVKSKPMQPLSDDAAELVWEIAETMGDERIKKSLQSIADYGREKIK